MEFLLRVWEKQPKGYFFLDGKDVETGEWRERYTANRKKPPVYDAQCFDSYFAVNSFADPKRTLDSVNHSCWLYADLDEADPTCDEFVRPTIAWETSPGRYQAMWQLTKRVSPELHSKLNRRVTYLVGADKGGWGLNKVLRIPGTINHKRDIPFTVTVLWDDGTVYDPRELVPMLKQITIPELDMTPPELGDLPKQSPRSILKKHEVPKHIRRTLGREPKPREDRSVKLFRLEDKLLKCGLSPQEVFVVVRASKWNKYAGQRRESQQLWREINKHALAQEANTPERKSRLNVLRFQPFLRSELPAPKWGVEDIWSDRAHGIIAGEAKSYKSLICMDMGLSVASGTKFLNSFNVPETGPVVYVQAENQASFIQDRISKLAAQRGLTDKIHAQNGSVSYTPGKDVPMYFVNNPTELNLRKQETYDAIVELAEEIKPKLMIFDPWYLLATGVDENSANQVAPVLKALMEIKLKFDTGILLVHHFRKPQPDVQEADLHKISGSSVFGRWFQSALIVQKGDEPHSAKLTPYHREFPTRSVIQVEFDIGEYGTTDYDCWVEVKTESVATPRKELRMLVKDSPGMTFSELSAALGLNRKRVERMAIREGYTVRPVPGKKGRGGVPMGVFP